MTRQECLLLIVISTWAVIVPIDNAFGGNIYLCVDKEGKKQYQDIPCDSNKKTLKVFKESSHPPDRNSASTPVASDHPINSKQNNEEQSWQKRLESALKSDYAIAKAKVKQAAQYMKELGEKIRKQGEQAKQDVEEMFAKKR